MKVEVGSLWKCIDSSNVDNWEGYGYAMQEYYDNREED